MHIFFAQRSTKKVKGVTDVRGLKPRAINKVGRAAHPLLTSSLPQPPANAVLFVTAARLIPPIPLL